MSKFTPGPWHFVADHKVNAGAFDILLANPDPTEKAEWEANARLIATAPEMHEALRMLDSMWAGEGYKTPESRQSRRILAPDTLALWKQVRAALAKADGGTR